MASPSLEEGMDGGRSMIVTEPDEAEHLAKKFPRASPASGHRINLTILVKRPVTCAPELVYEGRRVVSKNSGIIPGRVAIKPTGTSNDHVSG